MLANYDAEAVADVMGLVFLRTGGEDGRPSVAERDRDVGVRHVRLGGASRRASKPHAAARQPVRPTPILIEMAVEEGLPRHALRHLAEWLAGTDPANVTRLERGLVPKTTLERRVTRLSPEESELTERIARLSVHARRALGTDAEARAFMTTPHPELEGRSPLDAAKTDLGCRRAEAILNALEYGLAL